MREPVIVMALSERCVQKVFTLDSAATGGSMYTGANCHDCNATCRKSVQIFSKIPNECTQGEELDQKSKIEKSDRRSIVSFAYLV